MGRGRLLELPENLEPVHAWQPKVEQDQVEMLLPDQSKRRGRIPGTREGNVIVVQQPSQQLRQARIIFDQQDLRHR